MPRWWAREGSQEPVLLARLPAYVLSIYLRSDGRKRSHFATVLRSLIYITIEVLHYRPRGH